MKRNNLLWLMHCVTFVIFFNIHGLHVAARVWNYDVWCPESTDSSGIYCDDGWVACDCGDGEGEGGRPKVWFDCEASGGIAYCGWPDRIWAWNGWPVCPDLSHCLGCNDATGFENPNSIECLDCLPGYYSTDNRCTYGFLSTSLEFGVDYDCPASSGIYYCDNGWRKCWCGDGTRVQFGLDCEAYGGIAFCGFSDSHYIDGGMPDCPDLSSCDECTSAPASNWYSPNSIGCPKCYPGYYSTHCQSDLNECAYTPCGYGTYCVNTIGSYRCDCLSGHHRLNPYECYVGVGWASLAPTNGEYYYIVGETISVTASINKGDLVDINVRSDSRAVYDTYYGAIVELTGNSRYSQQDTEILMTYPVQGDYTPFMSFSHGKMDFNGGTFNNPGGWSFYIFERIEQLVITPSSYDIDKEDTVTFNTSSSFVGYSYIKKVVFGDGHFAIGQSDNFTHKYTKCGVFYFYVSAYNVVSQSRAFGLEPIHVKCDTDPTLSLLVEMENVPVPDGIQTFYLESQETRIERELYDNVNISVHHSNGFTENHSSQNLSLLIPYIFTDEFPVIDANHNVTSEVRYPKGDLAVDSVYDVEQVISGLEVHILPHDFSIARESFVTMNISVRTGSHVTYHIMFGDGTNFTMPHPMKFATDFPIYEGHTYSDYGHFIPTVIATNQVSSMTIALEPIIVLDVVSRLILHGPDPDPVLFPDGRAMFTVTVPFGLPAPQEVVCEWRGPGLNVSSEASELAFSLPHNNFLNLDAHYVGNVTIEAECSNLVSQYKMTKDFTYKEQLAGLHINFLSKASKTGHPFVIEVELEKGSHASVEVTFGNGFVQIFDFPRTSVRGQALEIQHAYGEKGNYTVNVVAYNGVNTIGAVGKDQAIIQNPVTNLSLYQPIPSTYGVGSVVIVVDPSYSPFPPSEVFITWVFPMNDSEKDFVPALSRSENFRKYYSMPQIVGPGLHLIEANCSNLVSWEYHAINITSSIPSELVSINPDKNAIEVGDSVSFTIDVRQGTHSDFTILFGDGSSYELKYEAMKAKVEAMYHMNTRPGNVLVDISSDITIQVPISFLAFGKTYKEWLGSISKVFVKRRYTTAGDYVPGVIATNGLGSHSISFESHLHVQHKMHEGLSVSFVSPISSPPGIAIMTFTVTYDPAPTGVNCKLKFMNSQDYIVQNVQVSAMYGTPDTAYISLPNMVGIVNVIANCSNEISHILLNASFEIQEQINGFFIPVEYSQSAISSLENVTFTMIIPSGSSRSIKIEYGDGSESEIFDIDDTYERFNFTHIYDKPGSYLLEVTILNDINSEYRTSNIQVHPNLHRSKINVGGDVYIADPPNSGSIKMVDPYNVLTQPDTIYMWKIYDERGELYINLNQTTNEGVDIECLSVTTYRVNLTIRNPLGSRTFEEIVACQESIFSDGIEFYLNDGKHEQAFDHYNQVYGIPIDKPTKIIAKSATGTSVHYKWIIDGVDITNETSHNYIDHHFQGQDNFNLTIIAFNGVSQVSKDFALIAMDRVVIEELSPLFDIVPMKETEFKIRFSHAISPFHCTKVISGGGGKPIYLGPGCNLNVSHLSKYEINYDMLLFTYSFTKNGAFDMHVESQNPGSKDIKVFSLAVNEKPCEPPEVKMQGLGRNKDRPREEFKSANIRVSAFTYVSCQLTNKVVFQWYIKKASMDGDFRKVDISKTSEIYFPPLYFELGIYHLKLTVNMNNTFGLIKEDSLYLEVVPTPLAVYLNGGVGVNQGWNRTLLLNAWDRSFDPDFAAPDDKDGLIFTWTCRISKESATSAIKKIMSVNTGNNTVSTLDDSGCFVLDDVEEKGPGQILLPTNQLRIDGSYNYTVTVSKGDKMSSYSQLVTIVYGDPPTIEISCWRNCGPKANPSQGIVLFVKCLSCKINDDPSYEWQLFEEDPIAESLYPINDLQNIDLQQSSLILPKNTLYGGKIYRARAYVRLGFMSNQGFNEFSLKTNLSPYNGACDISPKTGFAMETEFTARCTGWKDEGDYLTRAEAELHNIESLIRYRVATLATPDSDDSIFLMETTLENIGPFKLPEGDSGQHFARIIEITVFDDIGESTIHRAKVEVRRPLRGMTVAMEMITPPSNSSISALDQLLGSESVQFVIPSLLAAGSIIKREELYTDTLEQPVIDAQDKIADGFLEISHYATTFDSILQCSTSINAVLTSSTTHKSRVATIETAATLFKNQIELNSMSWEEKENLTYSIYSMLVKTESTAANKVRELDELTISELEMGRMLQQQNDDISAIASPRQMEKKLFMEQKRYERERKKRAKEARKILLKGEQIMADLKESLMEQLVEGDTTAAYNTQQFSASLKFLNASEIQSVPKIPIGDFGEVELNPINGMESAVLSVQTFKQNPYTWPESAAFITSPVIFVTLHEENSENSNRKKREIQNGGFTAKVNTDLPVNSRITVIPKEGDDLTYHTVNMTATGSVLLIELVPFNISIIYQVFLSQDDFPNTTHYDRKAMLDTSNSFSTIFDRGNITNATYIIGIKQYIGSVAVDEPLEYKITLLEAGCRQYSVIDEEWATEDCVVDTSSLLNNSNNTMKAVKVSTNSLKPLGVGLFVPPNMIDFKAVFSNFSERLMDSPVVLAVMLTIIILYIPLLLWMRRKDIKDQMKWRVWNVSDNFDEDRYRYKIYVHTGIKRRAGTRSQVYIQLAGTKGKTSCRKLNGAMHDGFGTGSIYSYLLTSPNPLGKLQYARIGHDSSAEGKYKGWYLSELAVEDLNMNEKYIFLCNQWMDAEEDDGRTERILSVDDDKTAKQFQNLMARWTRKTLFDQHLWFSVFVRTERSNFTRAQRLTCCLAILFLTMVANAMWYREDAAMSYQPFTLTLGPLIITYYQIYASIMTTLIVFPVSLLIIQVFRNTDATTLTFLEAIRDLKAFMRRNMVDKGIQMESPQWFVPIDDDSDDMLTGVTTEHVWKKTKNRRLPYVFTYLAWGVCLLATVLSAFFTFMYSLQWGGEKSNRWLTAFILSTGENIGIFSTAQVLVMAVIFAWLMKEPEEEGDEKEMQEEIENRRNLFMSDYEKRLTFLHSTEQNIYKTFLEALVNLKSTCLKVHGGGYISDSDDITIDVSERDTAANKRKENQKMFFFLVTFCFRVAYIICLIIVANGSMSTYGFIQYQDVSSTFGTDELLIKESGPKGFWLWAEDTFLPNLYGDEWYNGQPATWRERRFIYNRESFRVGPARLRQVRTIPGGCTIVDKMKDFMIECNPEFSTSGQDTRSFLANWTYSPWNMSDSDPAFIYHTATELGGIPVYGHFNLYDSGGYIVDLPEELDEAQDMIQSLKDSDWLDLYTRAVAVEFTVFNANTNMFSHVMLLFEMPSTGGILNLYFVEPFKVYDDKNSNGLVVLICQLVSIVIFLYYTGALIKAFRKSKPRVDFFKSLTNLLELLHICLGSGVIALFFMKNVMTSKAVGIVLEAKGTFFNFQELALTTYTFVSVFGLVIFVNAILLLNVLQVSWRFRVIASLMRKGTGSFIAFFIQFSILDIGFVTFFFTYFGKSRMEYSTFMTTFGSMFAVFLGGGANFKIGVAAGEDEFGRLMMVVFAILMVFAFTNVFVSMIIQLIDEATDIADEMGDQELDPVGYIKDGVKKQVKDFKELLNEFRAVFRNLRNKKSN